MKTNELPALLPTREEMARAFATKDASYDGVFYVAVKTTGIFCRPSCPSRPNLENVEFFSSVKDCLFAGYRPCKRCHPLEANGKPPEWARELISRVEAAPEARFKAADLRALGITPERARRWFQQHYGMSFTAWCRGNRLAGAFMRIRHGAALDDAIFPSRSRHREARCRNGREYSSCPLGLGGRLHRNLVLAVCHRQLSLRPDALRRDPAGRIRRQRRDLGMGGQ